MSSNARTRRRDGVDSRTADHQRSTNECDDRERARHLARQLCRGFVAHDERDEGESVEAFATVDRHQFAHLTAAEADDAARAYVDALWEKDAVESPHVDGETVVDPDGLAAAGWSDVEANLARRADVVGMDEAYARHTTAAWRQHKLGGDYWTPTMAAQKHEIRVAVDDPDYPDKSRFGSGGFGHLATRYLTGVELHDERSRESWENAVAVMTPYFDAILSRQEATR